MIRLKAKGSVYITSRFVKDKWVIRILDEDSCLIEVEATVEPSIIGDVKIPEWEPPRPNKTL